jgi:pimeloyl-ACP methyl ester carboxylesterase
MRGEFIDLNGERLYYYAAGTRGAGDPIVLIHGFPASGHVWFDVVAKLPPGHRVIVLDLPGFGRSDPPAGGAGQLASHAVRVALLLHLLKVERACVVGHGAGGAIAQLMAAVPGQVSALGIVACGNAPFPPTGLVQGMISRAARFAPPSVWQPFERFEIVRGYVDPERGRRSAEVFLKPFAGASGGALFAGHFEELRGSDFMAGSAAVPISVPTAILAGRDDPYVSLDRVRALQSAIPGATLRVCDGQRHYLPEEAPSEVAAMIATLVAR